MVELMDQNAWKPSQSGRLKQDYGPKVNFKKRKLKVAGFSGLPRFSQELVTQMKTHSLLAGFFPVEQCNLDYSPKRGSAIDPHLDDWWLWGERLVTLNLLSGTVLSMSCDSGDSVQLFSTFPSIEEQVPGSGSPSDPQNHHQPTTFTPAERLGNTIEWAVDCCSSTKLVPSKDIVVAVHLPRRSLVVLNGPARYVWKHAIYRNHITSRRICVTFREVSEEFRHGGEQEELGTKLLAIASTFQGTPVILVNGKETKSNLLRHRYPYMAASWSLIPSFSNWESSLPSWRQTVLLHTHRFPPPFVNLLSTVFREDPRSQVF